MSFSALLILVAVVAFILAALVAGGIITGITAGWLGYTGLACFAAAHFPGAERPVR